MGKRRKLKQQKKSNSGEVAHQEKIQNLEFALSLFVCDPVQWLMVEGDVGAVGDGGITMA